MPDSIVTAYEESDVLDPRTDAVRPSVPPVIKPVDLGSVHVETPVSFAYGGSDQLAVPRDLRKLRA